MPPGLKTFSAYAAAGLSGILALVALNVAAEKLPIPGLKSFRDYVVKAIH
jgi:hypothetical protein